MGACLRMRATRGGNECRAIVEIQVRVLRLITVCPTARNKRWFGKVLPVRT